jgi:hypothetical protein
MRWKLILSIALMMEAARTSETLANFYQTTRRYNPEDSHLHVELMPELRNTYKILIGKGEEKRSLGILRLDGRILLKLILNK